MCLEFAFPMDKRSWQNHTGGEELLQHGGRERHDTAGIIDGYTLPRYLARPRGWCLCILCVYGSGLLLLSFRVACQALIWSWGWSSAQLRRGSARRFAKVLLVLE